MSTKWKTLAGELYDIYVYEVEMFNWRDAQYFMSTRWTTLAGELYDVLCS